jgi:hypothetical protein
MGTCCRERWLKTLKRTFFGPDELATYRENRRQDSNHNFAAKEQMLRRVVSGQLGLGR